MTEQDEKLKQAEQLIKLGVPLSFIISRLTLDTKKSIKTKEDLPEGEYDEDCDNLEAAKERVKKFNKDNKTDKWMVVLPDQYTNLKYCFHDSRSGNLHILVKMEKPLDVFQRISWQLLLGSDEKREMISLKRAMKTSLILCYSLWRKGE